MRTVAVSWDPEHERFTAIGSHTAHTITVNGPRPADVPGPPTGFSPTELLLASIGACSAWDVVEILRKSRLGIAAVDVRVMGEQSTVPPHEYRHIALRYTVRGRNLRRDTVERAIRLSVDRYCSVLATVRGVASTDWVLDLVDDGGAPPLSATATEGADEHGT